ncbi:MAG: RidA family protein [Candidatus Erginobacter occultus]|nr:RidA family protein [Candidatus Erginobacter occultus]
MKEIIQSEKAPAAIGPYSQGVGAGGLVFVSGQIPLNLEGEIVEGGIEEQTVQSLENLKAVLEAAGLGLEEVVRATVYLRDLKDFNRFNEVYGRYFPKNSPARACVGVSALPRGARVEISAVAARNGISAFDFQ